MQDSGVQWVGTGLNKPPMIPLSPWWRHAIKGMEANKRYACLDGKVIVTQAPGSQSELHWFGLLSSIIKLRTPHQNMINKTDTLLMKESRSGPPTPRIKMYE